MALVIIGLLVAFAIGFSVCALLSDNKRAQLEDRLRTADALCVAADEIVDQWTNGVSVDYLDINNLRKAIDKYEEG